MFEMHVRNLLPVQLCASKKNPLDGVPSRGFSKCAELRPELRQNTPQGTVGHSIVGLLSVVEGKWGLVEIWAGGWRRACHSSLARRPREEIGRTGRERALLSIFGPGLVQDENRTPPCTVWVLFGLKICPSEAGGVVSTFLVARPNAKCIRTQ